MRRAATRICAAGIALLAATILLTMAPSTPSVSAASPTDAARVIAAAEQYLHHPYRWGAEGPTYFDCSGLVLRAFSDVGLANKVGGWSNRSAYSMYAWFRARGLASRSGGQPGDLVIWAGGAHVGIYLGHGKAISALVNGVQIHGIYQLTTPFTAYLHTGLSGTSTTSVTASVKKAWTRFTSVATNLRTGPSTAYRRIAVLAKGTSLKILGHRADSHHRTWYHVRTSTGRTGWVAAWLTRG